MDGRILTSEGQYIAYIQANQIYYLSGKKLTPSVAKKSIEANSLVTLAPQPEIDGWTNPPTDCFRTPNIEGEGMT